MSEKGKEKSSEKAIAFCDAKGATLLDEFAGRVLHSTISATKRLIDEDPVKLADLVAGVV